MSIAEERAAYRRKHMIVQKRKLGDDNLLDEEIIAWNNKSLEERLTLLTQHIESCHAFKEAFISKP